MAMMNTRSSESTPVEVETTYLDLDGDGVPDAVQTVEAIPVDRTGDGVTDAVGVVEEIASDIGDDGVPEHIDVVETKIVELPATPSA